MKAKKKKPGCWSAEKKKEEAKNVVFWLKQRHMKGEKHIVQINFAEYLRKWDVFREHQSFYGRFLKNGLHEMYYISKSRWEVQYLEKSGYWSRDDGGNEWPRFLLECALQCPNVYYFTPLLTGRLHLLITTSYYFFFVTFRLSI